MPCESVLRFRHEAPLRSGLSGHQGDIAAWLQGKPSDRKQPTDKKSSTKNEIKYIKLCIEIDDRWMVGWIDFLKKKKKNSHNEAFVPLMN